MSLFGSLLNPSTGVLGVPVLLVYKTVFCIRSSTKSFRSRAFGQSARKTSPRRDKRGATARPHPTVAGGTSAFNCASKWLQRRSLKTQESFSNLTNGLPAEFSLNLRRFVSHRNARRMRRDDSHGNPVAAMGRRRFQQDMAESGQLSAKTCWPDRVHINRDTIHIEVSDADQHRD